MRPRSSMTSTSAHRQPTGGLSRRVQKPDPTSPRPRPVGDVDPYVPNWLARADSCRHRRRASHGHRRLRLLRRSRRPPRHRPVPRRCTHDSRHSQRATREATDTYGVYWLASDVYAGGGKIILTAGAPRSTGRDEDAAVRAARSLIETDVGLPIRVGLNRGPVYMGDLGSSRRRTFTVMGDAVNLARPPDAEVRRRTGGRESSRARSRADADDDRGAGTLPGEGQDRTDQSGARRCTQHRRRSRRRPVGRRRRLRRATVAARGARHCDRTGRHGSRQCRRRLRRTRHRQESPGRRGAPAVGGRHHRPANQGRSLLPDHAVLRGVDDAAPPRRHRPISDAERCRSTDGDLGTRPGAGPRAVAAAPGDRLRGRGAEHPRGGPHRSGEPRHETARGRRRPPDRRDPGNGRLRRRRRPPARRGVRRGLRRHRPTDRQSAVAVARAAMDRPHDVRRRPRRSRPHRARPAHRRGSRGRRAGLQSPTTPDSTRTPSTTSSPEVSPIHCSSSNSSAVASAVERPHRTRSKRS